MITTEHGKRLRSRTLFAKLTRTLGYRTMDAGELIFLLPPIRLAHLFRLAQLVAVIAVGFTAHIGLWTMAIVAMLGAILAELMILERRP